MANTAIDPRLQYQHAPPPYSVEDMRHGAHQTPSAQHPQVPQSIPLYQLHPVNHPQSAHERHEQRSEEPTLQDDDDESVLQDHSGQNSPAEHNANLGSAGKSSEKRPRACDSCRGLKVKCIIDPSSGEPCKRCAKARRKCIVTPPTRKRQKKADGRVAELERKIDALTASLAAREASVYDGIELDRLKAESASPFARHRSPQYQADSRLLGTAQTPPMSRQGDGSSEGSNKRRRLENIDTMRTHTPGSGDGTNVMPTPSSDPEGRGSIYNQKKPPVFDHSDIETKINDIIDPASAERLFNRYVNHVVPRFPAVPFPTGTKASTIRKEKPILFLAILSSTSYGTGIPEESQKKLESELRDVFAKAMWKNGEKTLEIVQALHVATLWYRPPANFEQHMFYQMVHMSAVMAIDIGIGKRQSPYKQKWFGSDPPPRVVPKHYYSIEAKRAWIVCYFLCISITMILRRPILVRFTEYLKECIEILETSKDALPSDKVLCQHVRIAHISEDIATQFAMDDPAINYTMTDRNVSFSIKHYEEQLLKIRESRTNDYALRLAEHVTNLYLHEIALHSQSNVDDFKGPWIQETFKTAVGDTVLGPEHIKALTACQESCRDILDTFLSYEFEVVYVLPVIFTGVRVIYAVVVIIKLYIAANSPGEISGIIKKEDLRVEEYLDKLQLLFKRIMDKDALSPHVKFLWVIERLQDRWRGIKEGKTIMGCRSTGKSTPLSVSESRPPPGVPPTSVPAQGLHLLSEVAMSNTQQHSGNVSQNGNATMVGPSQDQHSQQQAWFPHQQAEAAQAAQIASLPMDPNAYAYTGGLTAYDGFDYGIGNLGMGMDGAISGLFMPDGMWTFGQPPPDPQNAPQGFHGWH